MSARAAPAADVTQIEVDGRWLSFRETGSGDPVLLLHSGGFSSRQWRRLAERLAPTHRVLLPDFLGYGHSSPWPTGEPFHFRTDLAAVATLLRRVGAPAHLVGHSYGGLLAVQLAQQEPHLVRSLALYEPVCFSILDRPEDKALLDALPVSQGAAYTVGENGAADENWLTGFIDWWNGPGFWAALPEEAKAGWRATAWKVAEEVKSLQTDATPRSAYAAIATPTLLLGGEKTPATEQRVLRNLAATMPHATLQMFPEMGHMGPVTHASQVNAIIAAHIAAH